MHTSGRNNVPREATSCSFSRSAVYRNARIDARIFVARKELIQKKSHVVGAQARLNSVTQFSPPCTTQHVSPHTLLLVPFAQISFLSVFTTKGKGDAVVSARRRESSRLIHTGFSRRHTPQSPNDASGTPSVFSPSHGFTFHVPPTKRAFFFPSLPFTIHMHIRTITFCAMFPRLAWAKERIRIRSKITIQVASTDVSQTFYRAGKVRQLALEICIDVGQCQINSTFSTVLIRENCFQGIEKALSKASCNHCRRISCTFSASMKKKGTS